MTSGFVQAGAVSGGAAAERAATTAATASRHVRRPAGAAPFSCATANFGLVRGSLKT